MTRSEARSPSGGLTLTVPIFAGTIFLSAFMLFGIQPMVAKMILPRLGGSPSVWSVAMVFFQAALLAGYGYAHWLAGRFSVRHGAVIHLGLMAAVLALALPISLGSGFERPPEDGQMLWLVALMASSVGLPFFAVAANGPLLQAWFSRADHGRSGDPYFLYAASNTGSILALVAYPFAIEPFLPLAEQTWAWSWGFALLFTAIAACAFLARHGAAPVCGALAMTARAAIAGRQKLAWCALAFVPSGLLVAVTAHISTDIASIPLFWVVPLALFLLTFIVAFQPRPVVPVNALLVAHLALLMALSLSLFLKLGALADLVLNLGLFFVVALIAHGELARRRPGVEHLTQFYLWISFGGVLGGLFSGLLAPALFNSVLEYPLLLAASLLCWPNSGMMRLSSLTRLAVPVGLAAFAAVLIGGDLIQTGTVRSFFGVNRIYESDDGRYRLLKHGTTVHGAQMIRDAVGAPVTGRPEALSYYFSGGGLAEAIEAARRAHGGTLGRVAAVGLGTGSLACQTRPGEAWSFFEIDRAVARLASDPARFTFLSQCAPVAPIVIGDARLTLADVADGSLDLIILDAFSSDAIPVHLLTREALGLYLRKLTPRGVMVFHISNNYMDLAPVIAATAELHGLTTWWMSPAGKPNRLAEHRYWPEVAVVARRPEDAPLPRADGWRPVPVTVRPWRDDYADIVSAIWRKLGG